MVASETWLLSDTPFLGRPGSRSAVVCGWSGRRIIDGQNGGLVLPTEPVSAHVLEWVTRRCTYRARSSSSACGSSTRARRHRGAQREVRAAHTNGSARSGHAASHHRPHIVYPPQVRLRIEEYVPFGGAQEAMGDIGGAGIRDGVVRV